MKKGGYHTLSAYNGDDALKLFRENSPSIIILDIMMPDLDGFEVCKAIRNVSKVPIIMLTAKGEDIDKI